MMNATTCQHCGRRIIPGEPGEYAWIDPDATGDDSTWRETCDAHDTRTAEHEPERVSPDQLNALVEFDSPFEVTVAGEVKTPVSGVYAPSVFESGEREPDIDGSGWSFVNGYSGQDRYSGPIMHASEYLGGGMARDVLDDPGIYVVCVVEDMDDPENPSGWVLLRRTEEES